MTEDLLASCECCLLILHICYTPAQPQVCPSAPRGTHQENHSGGHGVNKPEVFVIQRKFLLLYENISMHELKENETESKEKPCQKCRLSQAREAGTRCSSVCRQALRPSLATCEQAEVNGKFGALLDRGQKCDGRYDSLPSHMPKMISPSSGIRETAILFPFKLASGENGEVC